MELENASWASTLFPPHFGSDFAPVQYNTIYNYILHLVASVSLFLPSAAAAILPHKSNQLKESIRKPLQPLQL